MSNNEIVTSIILLACQIVILFISIVSHEVAHGFMAFKLGDPTAKNMGRLTLNPIRHIDPWGSVAFLVTMVLTMLNWWPLPIGWAKPVMIDYRYFRNPRQSMALVAFAGPMTNLALSAAFLFIYKVLDWIPMMVSGEIGFLCVFGVFINLALALFNLIPIPPFDGSNILAGFLPWRFTIFFYRMRYVGFAIVVMTLMTIGKENMFNFVAGFYGMFGIKF